MQRVKTFEATGVAPNGRMYAGDLNGIQDAAAALTDFAQTLSLGNLRIGETGLTLSRIGSGEAQLSGDLRVTKIVRALEGLILGAFTTSQRDAITSGRAPYGTIILNTTLNKLQWNSGSDASRSWSELGGGIDLTSGLVFTGSGSHVYFTSLAGGAFPFASKRNTDTQYRFALRDDGYLQWGPGGSSAPDTSMWREAANVLRTMGKVIADGGFQLVDGTLLNEATDVGGFIYDTFANRPAANNATRKFFVATNQGFTLYYSDGTTWHFLSQRDAHVFHPSGGMSAGSIQVAAPSAGTYIISYGAPGYSSGGQGSYGFISVAGGPQVSLSDVGGAGAVAEFTKVLTAGEVVTATISTNTGGSTVNYPWLRLTRIA